MFQDTSWINWDEHLDFMTGGMLFDDITLLNDYSASALKNSPFNALRSDSWLVWRSGSLNTAIKDLQRPKDKIQKQVAIELDLSQDSFQHEQGLKNPQEYGKFDRNDGVLDIQFSLHMPPTVRGERVQPLATVDDDSAALPRGHIFDIRAKVTSYKKASTKVRRCFDGPSLYSWQV